MDAPENATPTEREVYENAARMSAPAQGLTALKAATVFHGSPHKFTKFDPKKIGTGEGAQAYGHGMYVAESPEVAGQYRKQLAPGFTRTVDDVAFDASNPQHLAASYMQMFGKRGKSPAEIAKILNEGGHKEAAQLVLSGKKLGQMGEQAKGSLYKIDLPDEAIARMLDWDKPISEQASILKRISPESMGLRYKLVDDGKKHAFVNADERIIGNIQEGGTPESFRANWMQSFMRPQMTGRQVYEELGGGMFGSDKAASALRQAGIPGIRYLDEQSRGRGQGTSNFVVFPGEEELLRILERNGVPIQSLLD
jgi:hypothetical protein